MEIHLPLVEVIMYMISEEIIVENGSNPLIRATGTWMEVPFTARSEDVAPAGTAWSAIA